MLVLTSHSSQPGSALACVASVRLAESSHRSLRFISCVDHDGVLTQQGSGATFNLKQLAQSIVGKIDGVLRIVNCLEVPAVASLHEAPATVGSVFRSRPR